MAGATVKAKGTTIGTQTDANGEFKLTIPTSVKFIDVSFIGMFPVEVAVKPNLTIYMEENQTVLDEVVVTGYGSTRKAAFTGAASVVNGDVVDRKSDANFVKSLEGQVTGFQYNNSTSSPGQWGSVYVRGMSSLSSSSQPLYVIDGIPVNSDYDDMGSSNNYFDPMAAYNPSDIESVTVLKDAAATAIYGSRAANGVIVITTKKGGQSKLSVTFETRQGFSSMANNNMKYANAEKTANTFARGFVAGGYYPDMDAAVAYVKRRYNWDGVTDVNWIDEVTRKGYYQDYNLSFNGTVGTTNYYANLSYNDVEGLVINSGNQRYSGRLNLDTKYRFLSVGMNASYSYSTNKGFSQSTGGSMSSPLVGAVSSMLPFYAPYVGEGADREYNPINYNPLAVSDPDLGDLNEVTNQTINANPWLRIDFGKGIWFKTNFGVNIMDQRQYQYWSAVYNPQAMDYNGLGQEYNSKTTTLTWTNTFGWNYKFNDLHSIDLLFGQEMQRYNYWYEYYSGCDFPFADSGMRDLATAGNMEMGSEYYKAESRLASYFMDLHYSFADRYYLSASYRRDGSSVFGAANRWGNFWSVGGKWRVTEESFLKGNRALTNLALRLSYGTVGNQSLPSLYAARGYYAAGYNYAGVPGMVPAQMSNPDLTWETSKKFDVGFDASLFNRVHFTFDYYNELTDDALYSVPLSYTTGLGSSYRNIGKIKNYGVEFGANGTAFYNNDILVSLFANITWNRNKVIKLANGDIVGSYTIVQEGRPYRQFYMPEYAGVDKETGKALYYLNEEGDETTDKLVDAAKRYVGSAEPKVFGAFGLNANAYGFDLSMQFNYRLGSKVMDTGHSFTGWGMSLRTPLEIVADNSWTPENPTAKYPQYIYGDPNSSLGTSSRWLMNGSYLRLSNITFGYTLPVKLTRKAFMEKVRFYTTFDNVHTWTASDFVGYNPETYSSGQIAWQYPAVFTFTGGVQITF
ncbi:MAG: SusC/RagA family TonB-linked outer membrane protein [Paramuribaculum sp.]|nr:SusC/RagA family TonB-linked outer membrane protein [Paramuribaculum sp.]